MTHELKVLSEYYWKIPCEKKTFELRKDDRDYKVGDILDLKEWDGEKEMIKMKGEPMLKHKDCEALVFYAAFMGREVAKGADEQEALLKLQGAIVMFMIIDGISSSRADDIYNFVYGTYQKSLIAYFEDKGEDEQE